MTEAICNEYSYTFYNSEDANACLLKRITETGDQYTIEQDEGVYRVVKFSASTPCLEDGVSVFTNEDEALSCGLALNSFASTNYWDIVEETHYWVDTIRSRFSRDLFVVQSATVSADYVAQYYGDAKDYNPNNASSDWQEHLAPVFAYFPQIDSDVEGESLENSKSPIDYILLALKARGVMLVTTWVHSQPEDGAPSTQYVFYDERTHTTTVLAAQDLDSLLPQALAFLKDLDAREFSDNDCAVDAEYDSFVDNNQAPAAACAESLTQITGVAHEAVLVDENSLTPDDYEVRAQPEESTP